MLLHCINSSSGHRSLALKQHEYDNSNLMLTTADLEAHIGESCKVVSTAYGVFKNKTVEQVSINHPFIYFLFACVLVLGEELYLKLNIIALSCGFSMVFSFCAFRLLEFAEDF